jgi:hypothetical protein
MDESFTKLDIIIIIILSLLVAFIIGFNIIQIIDNKLNSVVINIPPSNCTLPPIYVNFDKDNKPTKLNKDQINILSDRLSHDLNDNSEKSENSENFSNYSDNNSNNNSVNNSVNNYNGNSDNNSDGASLDDNIIEEYGNLKDNTPIYNDEEIRERAMKISSNLGNKIISQPQELYEVKDQNYNTLNNMPYLIDPENSNKGYYPSRVKLISDPKSPLLRLEEKNTEIIQNLLNKCKRNEPESAINQTYDGYNKYPDLRTDSYSNVTAIGKNLMTPYISFPVPS